jgi:crotonobetainyl-CoA:carnitine CoA-transferase CaiB-like acyl-CoA transferase
MALFKQNGVPAARIRNMEEVFELPAARAMILEEKLPDGTLTRCLRTNAFKIGSPLHTTKHSTNDHGQ